MKQISKNQVNCSVNKRFAMLLLVTGFLCCLKFSASVAQNPVFVQDFNASPRFNEYAEPGASNKFDFIGGDGKVLIENGRLSFTRSSSDAYSVAVRSTDLLGAPLRALKISFLVNIASSGLQAPLNNCVQMQFGSDFKPTIYLESNPNASIQFDALADGKFRLRSAFKKTSSLNGFVMVTCYLNNTGVPMKYSMDGVEYSLADDQMDFWAGDERVLSALPVSNPLQAISDFKIVNLQTLPAGATVTSSFDDLNILNLLPAGKSKAASDDIKSVHSIPADKN